MKQQHMFSNRMICALLVPVVLEQLLNSIMGTADTMMVSNVGSAEISAVSLVDSINILVIQAFSALAAGGAIVCAQYIGQQNHKKANESARQVLFIITAISVAVSLLCLVFQRPLLRLIFGSVEAEVMRNSRIYFFFTALSFPFIAAYDAAASIFRAQDNTRGPMLISMISNGMNIVGNAIMIWGFHMGVAGAALSTLVSRIFCAVVVLIQLRRERQPIVVRDYYKIRPDWKMIRRILGLGIPSGVENSMFQLGKLAIQSTVSTLGTVAIAAQAMTNILENLNGIAAHRCWGGADDDCRTVSGSRKKRRSDLLYQETVCYCRSDPDLQLSAGILAGSSDYNSRGNGSRKCKDVYPYDILDYRSQTIGMDDGIYPGIWFKSSRGREVLHDYFLCNHVVLQILPLCAFDPCLWIRPDGSLDWNVCRLDTSRHHFQPQIPQQEMAGTPSYLKTLFRGF